MHDLIEKYPHIPQFKNQLSNCYAFIKNFKKANEANRWIVKEHPDYLFGKLNLANEYIAKKQFEKVPVVLGQLLELKDLYPQRKVFHLNEVISFYTTAIHYFTGIKNLEAAESRLDILKEIDDGTADIDRLNMLLMLLRMETGMKRWDEERKKAKTVKVKAKKITGSSVDKPVFNHVEVEQLYCNSMRIPHAVLKNILLLPRETLIDDLHKVIYDSILRFKYFSEEMDWNAETHEVLLHAMFILSELKSEKSLQIVLDILRQDEEYFDFWLNDFLTEDFWKIIYPLGFNKLSELKNFMMEPDHYCYARSVVSSSVAQIALHHPERQSEIINWYKEILIFFVAEKANERIIDSDLNGFLIGEILDFKGIELFPQIIEIFNHGIVSESISGDLKEVTNEFNNPKYAIDHKREIHNSIFSMYEEIVNTWHYYTNEDEFEDDELYDNDDVNFNDSETPDDSGYSAPVTYVRTEPKTGRNDPCTCGSGLKYKRCHGK
ncbi:MAG: DUF1186 domain-containing protein [Bacteroidia bacterium]